MSDLLLTGRTRRALGATLVSLAVLASACSGSAAVDGALPERAPTATPTDVAPPEPTATLPPSAVPSVSPTLAPATVTPVPPTPTAITVPTVTPTPQPDGPCGAGPLALPDPNRPVYTAELEIDPATRTMVGAVQIEFTPDLAVDDLVIRLWPNGPRPSANGVEMLLTRSAVNGRELEPQPTGPDGSPPDPTLVHLLLPETQPPDTTMVIDLDVRLVVPLEGRSRLAGADDYMRLGTALPLLPWEPGVGWATDPATALFAESVLSPVADYSVDIDVPDGFEVLASGAPDDDGVWRVEAARDFAITVGRFRTLSGTANAPRPVEVTVGVHESLVDDEAAYLAKVVDSLEQFSARFGQYPWPTLTFAITPNLRGGIEFPTHVMQGPDTIGRTTSHEVGHMWFYSLVGNNQGADPWLDEGLASYAEFTYEGTAANAWTIPAVGVGRATEPMTFWADRSDSYYRAVYSQTGFALMNLGERAEVDCALARYVAANAHGIARPADVVEAFEPDFPDFIDRMRSLGVDLSG